MNHYPIQSPSVLLRFYVRGNPAHSAPLPEGEGFSGSPLDGFPVKKGETRQGEGRIDTSYLKSEMPKNKAPYLEINP